MTWTAQEDLLLQIAVRHLGSNWPVISSVLPGRTADGLRNRWYRLQKQPTSPCALLVLNKLFGVAPVGTATAFPSEPSPPGAQALPTVYGVACPSDGTSAPAAKKRKSEDAEIAQLRRQVASLQAENQSLRGAPQPPAPQPPAPQLPPPTLDAVLGSRTSALGAEGWGWGDDDDSSEESLLRQLAESLQDEDLKLCIEAQTFGKGMRRSSSISISVKDAKGRRSSSINIRRSSSINIRRSSSTNISMLDSGGKRRSSVISLREILDINDIGKRGRSSSISMSFLDDVINDGKRFCGGKRRSSVISLREILDIDDIGKGRRSSSVISPLEIDCSKGRSGGFPTKCVARVSQMLAK